MDDNRRYEAFVRNRITELREQKGISEHRMSLELGKSGSYIRSITNGISMPSLRELFNIMEYLSLIHILFFAEHIVVAMPPTVEDDKLLAALRVTSCHKFGSEITGNNI